MKERDLAQFFEDNQNEAWKTPSSLTTKCRDIIAFLLLDKLVPGHTSIIAAATHDQIWLSPDPHKVNEVATDEELLTLMQCGVCFDDGEESFFMFV